MTPEQFKEKYSKETYIGDGVYVSFDGYSFNLRTPRENGDHHISLEPDMIQSILDYKDKVYKDAEDLK